MYWIRYLDRWKSRQLSPFPDTQGEIRVGFESAGIDDEQLGEFLRERGLHTEHLTIWDQKLRDMVDKKNEQQDKGKKRHLY